MDQSMFPHPKGNCLSIHKAIQADQLLNCHQLHLVYHNCCIQKQEKSPKLLPTSALNFQGYSCKMEQEI